MRPILDRAVPNEPAPTIQTGKHAAFLDFYHAEHAGQVRRAALLVGSDETANDVVRDAMTAMYQWWDTITDPGSLRPESWRSIDALLTRP